MKSQKNSGYTLITTMLIMIILFVIGAAGAMLVYYGNLTSGAMTNYQKAYYNADYGLQQAVYNVMNGVCNCQDNGQDNSCEISQTPLPTGGTVTVITQADTNNNTCFIESIGTGQTGGLVVKAIAIANTFPWPALYMGIGMPFPFGSGSINGCDPTCPGPGVISSIPVAGNNCSQDLVSNSKGVYGSPPWLPASIYKTLSDDVSTLLNGIVNNISNLANNNSNSGCSCNGNATASNGTIICPSNPNLSPSCQAYHIYGPLNIVGSNDFAGEQIYASTITISGNNLTIKGGLLDAGGLNIDVKGNSQIGTPDDPTAIISQGASVDINMNGTSSINGLLILNNSSSLSIGNVSINGAMYVNVGTIVTGGNSSINLNTAIIRQLLQEYPVLGKPPRCLPPQQYLFNAVTLY